MNNELYIEINENLDVISEDFAVLDNFTSFWTSVFHTAKPIATTAADNVIDVYQAQAHVVANYVGADIKYIGHAISNLADMSSSELSSFSTKAAKTLEQLVNGESAQLAAMPDWIHSAITSVQKMLEKHLNSSATPNEIVGAVGLFLLLILAITAYLIFRGGNKRKAVQLAMATKKAMKK